MFNCDICLYSTDRSSNLQQHNKSKKHIIRAFYESKKCVNIDETEKNDIETYIKNKELNKVLEKPPSKKNQTIEKQNYVEQDDNECDKYTCKICGKSYKYRQNLWTHKQQKHTTTENKDNDSPQIAMLISQIAQLQKKVEQLESEKNMCANNLTNSSNTQLTNSNNTFAKNIAENVVETNNNQKIINVFQYISQNFNDTEPIKMLESKEAKKMLIIKEDTKYTMADFIVFYYTKYELDRFLGDIIIGAYKKEDPKDQQIWSSNIVKLTFIVRQILNKENVWLKDINGVCITRHIIDPFLKEIKKLLQQYVKDCSVHYGKTYEQIEKDQNNGTFAIKIIQEINEKELHKKILKYIAPHFQLEQTNLLLMN
jgi:hypothetical protein